jgi:hypothetical protein
MLQEIKSLVEWVPENNDGFIFILSRDRVTILGIWTNNRIEILQLVTTSKDYAFAVLHTSQTTLEDTLNRLCHILHQSCSTSSSGFP